eukprot:GHRR01033758.1.p1 GENE.GHRR01033758.1~~GHRR01033758.1.p1  ORF type:complete len:102 (+),score=19.28 GHRR01033758.1:255-560(+)
MNVRGTVLLGGNQCRSYTRISPILYLLQQYIGHRLRCGQHITSTQHAETQGCPILKGAHSSDAPGMKHQKLSVGAPPDVNTLRASFCSSSSTTKRNTLSSS